jgi:hypothetical protein
LQKKPASDALLEAFEVGATANCELFQKLSFCFKHDLISAVFSRLCAAFCAASRNAICPPCCPQTARPSDVSLLLSIHFGVLIPRHIHRTHHLQSSTPFLSVAWNFLSQRSRAPASAASASQTLETKRKRNVLATCSSFKLCFLLDGCVLLADA